GVAGIIDRLDREGIGGAVAARERGVGAGHARDVGSGARAVIGGVPGDGVGARARAADIVRGGVPVEVDGRVVAGVGGGAAGGGRGGEAGRRIGRRGIDQDGVRAGRRGRSVAGVVERGDGERVGVAVGTRERLGGRGRARDIG